MSKVYKVKAVKMNIKAGEIKFTTGASTFSSIPKPAPNKKTKKVPALTKAALIKAMKKIKIPKDGIINSLWFTSDDGKGNQDYNWQMGKKNFNIDVDCSRPGGWNKKHKIIIQLEKEDEKDN